MGFVKASTGILALIALYASTGCASAVSVSRGQWHEISTDRFVMLTDSDPEQGRELLADLERYRQVILQKTTAQEQPDAPPLRIIAAKDTQSFEGLTEVHSSGGASVRGFFVQGENGNYMFLNLHEDQGMGGWKSDPRRALVFHELAHHIQALNGSPIPSWYNEGFAEYVSTITFADDGSYTLGAPPDQRMAILAGSPWLPLRELLEAPNVGAYMSKGYETYAQSWLLVHYLTHNNQGQQLADYLAQIASGVEVPVAFESAFGTTLAKMDVRLRSYARRPRFNAVSIQPARPLTVPEARTRVLSRDDAQLALGRSLLYVDPAVAARMLTDVKKRRPDHPAAHAGLAYAASQAGEHEAALAEIEHARRGEAQDPWLDAIEGHVYRMLAHHQREQNDPAYTESLGRARDAYRRAIRADGRLVEAYSGLGLTYLTHDNHSQEPIGVLEAALHWLPLRTELALALGQLHARRGNGSEALPPLRYVLSWTKSGKLRERASALIAQIQSENVVTEGGG